MSVAINRTRNLFFLVISLISGLLARDAQAGARAAGRYPPTNIIVASSLHFRIPVAKIELSLSSLFPFLSVTRIGGSLLPMVGARSSSSAYLAASLADMGSQSESQVTPAEAPPYEPITCTSCPPCHRCLSCPSCPPADPSCPCCPFGPDPSCPCA
jgi:hypothetical protein